MKILLINPPEYRGFRYAREGRCQQRISSYEYVFPPISLMTTAAVLEKENFDVKILDCTAENISWSKLENLINKSNPDMIVVTISTPSFYGDIKVADICKNLNILSVVIGVHCTALPEKTLLCSNFDVVVRGEPEITILEIAKNIGNKKNLNDVLGISYKKDAVIHHNKSRPFIKDLDVLPFPALHLINNKKYLFPFSKEIWTLVTINRGCPYNCIFCTSFLYYGKCQRFRSPSNVADEIEEIVTSFKIRKIGMWGEIFTISDKTTSEICNEIKKRNLDVEWYIASRADTLNNFRIKKLVSAGCKATTLGIESGSQKILNNIKKNITTRQAFKTIKNCKKFGLETQAHVMFGLPGENKKTAQESIKFIKNANPDYVNFYCAVPFPGTEFWNYVNKNNFLITKDWSNFEINNSVVSYPDFSNIDIKKIKKRAFIEFYLHPSKFSSILLRFKPWDYFNLAKNSIDFFNSWI